MGGGHAEHSDGGVPGELLDDAAMHLDLGSDHSEVGVEHFSGVLRIGGFRSRGKADEVAEENGDDLPLLLTRRSR